MQKLIVVRTSSNALPEGCVDYAECVSAQNLPTPPAVHLDATRDTMILPHSSGTTGLPKAVMLPHRMLVRMMSNLSKCVYATP